jgi:cupin 2 domain-containing protein
MTERRNLLDRIGDLPVELTEQLLSCGNVRIERIVSRGHASPRGFWYDQEEDEWVAVLSGGARLAVEGDGVREMGPGDWAWLPAHLRHRVEWTDPEVETVWLAVFIVGPEDADRGS